MTKVVMWGLLILFLELATVGAFVHDEWVRDLVRKEQAQTYQWMGAKTGAYIDQNAAHWFRVAFVETGLRDMSYKMLVPTEEEKARSRGLEHLGEPIFDEVATRLATLWLSIYQVLRRAWTLGIWIPYIGLMMVPVVIDGWYQRRIKMHRFGAVSVLGYRGAVLLVAGILYLWLVILLAPIAIHPMWFPVMGAVLAISVGYAIANLQKRF